MDIAKIDLKQLYDILNSKYFNDKLPASTSIEWSNRLTSSAGICYTNRKLIKLSTHYHLKYPQDIESTLTHEMIHLYVRGHSTEFYNEIERIRRLGGDVSRYSRARAVDKKPKWYYQCSNPLCRSTFTRIRRIPENAVCAKCMSRLIERKINL